LNSKQTPPDKSTSASPDHLAVPKPPKYSTSASKNRDVTPPTKAELIPSKCKCFLLFFYLVSNTMVVKEGGLVYVESTTLAFTYTCTY